MPTFAHNCWISSGTESISGGIQVIIEEVGVDEINARSELEALRTFVSLSNEIKLIREALDAPPLFKGEDQHSWRHLESRLHTAEQEIKQVHVYLVAAKWNIPLDIQDEWLGSADKPSSD